MATKSTLDEINELLEKLEKLAKHGFEFFIAGVGTLLFLLGIFANLIDTFDILLSENESLVITISGLVFVVLGVLIWYQKNRFIMQSYLAKLEWRKFRLKVLSKGDEDTKEPTFK